jgi:cell wall-associated NlpC family hydrolase
MFYRFFKNKNFLFGEFCKSLLILLPFLLLGHADNKLIVAQETRADVIRDIQTLVQDATVYLNQAGSSQRLIAPEIHQVFDAEFNEKFFSPWQADKRPLSKDEYSWIFRYLQNLGFGENKRRHSEEWFNNLTKDTHFESYPNAKQRAITITNTHLRVLPTNKPYFKTENGYPFDRLQNSAIWANTPVFISHVSIDKSWVLVESPFANGWIQVRDIALVDSHFIKAWKTNKYVALTKDKVAFYDESDLFRFKTHIGAVFPYVGESDTHYEVLIAIADKNRKALIEKAKISKSVAVVKPKQVLSSHIAVVINQLLNQAYGWGGMYENRDCSSALRDLFTPFGLWLPRNSTAQAQVGEFIYLGDLTLEEKEKMIIEKGVPFLTLLWKKGHIMLYIGSQNGKGFMFHNFWSITGEKNWIVGHSAITSLQPGAELGDAESNYLRKIIGMAILSPTRK